MRTQRQRGLACKAYHTPPRAAGWAAEAVVGKHGSCLVAVQAFSRRHTRAHLLAGPHEAVMQLQLVQQALAQRRGRHLAALVLRLLQQVPERLTNKVVIWEGRWLPRIVATAADAQGKTIRTFLLKSEPARSRSSLIVRPPEDARPAQVGTARCGSCPLMRGAGLR